MIINNLFLEIVKVGNIVVLGNTIFSYFVSLLIISLFFVLNKFVKKYLLDILVKFSEKTSIKFDDFLFKSLYPTINMFLFAMLFYFSYTNLNFSAPIKEVLDKTFNLLIIIPIVYFLIKFSTEVLGYYLKGNRTKADEAAIDLLIEIIRISLIIIGILLILDNLGYKVSTLITGLGIGGLAFALAAQDLLKNLFAGISIILDGTFSKGDRIKFSDQIGFVEKVKLRTTKVRTLDKTVVTVPNSMLTENVIENIQAAPKYKVSMVIGLTYSTSTEKLKEAKKVIETILSNEEKVDSFWVWFDEFGPYSLNLNVIYYEKYKYSDWPDRALLKEKINFLIKEKLEKIGVEMAFPTQTIELMNKSSSGK